MDKGCKEIRRKILDLALNKSTHLGSSLSIVEILYTLFKSVLKPEDKFILSKGHGALAYYAVLNHFGFISDDELACYGENESCLLGHPTINKKFNIPFSTGSLGMGLSIGIGIAIAKKIKNEDGKVYVLVGDGELNEGSCWEAIMSAYHFKLDNLTMIIDRNLYQLGGPIKDTMKIADLQGILRGFGWFVLTGDGNEADIIKRQLGCKCGAPVAMIAYTKKGKGFSFCEDNNDWHHATLNKGVYDQAVKELEMR